MWTDSNLTQLKYLLEKLGDGVSIPQAKQLVSGQLEQARKPEWSDEAKLQAQAVEGAVIAFVKAGAIQNSEAARNMFAELEKLSKMTAEPG